jgi:hypothetical protein
MACGRNHEMQGRWIQLHLSHRNFYRPWAQNHRIIPSSYWSTIAPHCPIRSLPPILHTVTCMHFHTAIFATIRINLHVPSVQSDASPAHQVNPPWALQPGQHAAVKSLDQKRAFPCGPFFCKFTRPNVLCLPVWQGEQKAHSVNRGSISAQYNYLGAGINTDQMEVVYPGKMLTTRGFPSPLH